MRAASLAAGLLTAIAYCAAPELPARENLQYEIEWRMVTAGRAALTWAAAEESDGWQIQMKLESVGLVSKLYKVDDTYTSVLGPGLCAISSHLIAHEGSKHRETSVTFDRETGKARRVETDLVKKAVVEDKSIDVAPCVRDVLGALYTLRTMDLKPGQSTEIPISDGKKSVAGKVEAQEREEIRIKGKVYKTVRYQAYLFNNVLYRRNARLYVWLTEDDRRLPVQIRVRMQFTIGTITLQLIEEGKA